jgi:hypothetical protein
MTRPAKLTIAIGHGTRRVNDPFFDPGSFVKTRDARSNPSWLGVRDGIRNYLITAA